MEAFGSEMNPLCSPPVSIKTEEEVEENIDAEVQQDMSDSELSSAKSMESIEFDESFSSSATQAPNYGTQPTTEQVDSSSFMEEPDSPQSSPFKLESASPSPVKDSSTSRKPLSRIRKECKHCGTVASIAWRNGPIPDRNRCMNQSCGLLRDR
ncbi:hypothetical protein N431DRAFT_189346 [Stipitochalara longipes BDJ]|nr:hypothetical protein N431DRAFT_189346 [Stipitochalara longipes BDJ]